MFEHDLQGRVLPFDSQAATSFASAYANHIAPSWFLLVAAAGWALALVTGRPLLRQDRLAAVGAAAIAITIGICAGVLAGPGFAAISSAYGPV